jgi:hypothetical protein
MNYTKEELEVLLFTLALSVLSRIPKMCSKSEEELYSATYQFIRIAAKNMDFEGERAKMEEHKKKQDEFLKSFLPFEDDFNLFEKGDNNDKTLL